MSIVRWVRKILPFLVFLNIRRGCQRRLSLIKIEVAKTYVLGVKKIRFFLLGVVFVLLSLVLLASGLLLIHMALFAYSGWSAQVKFLVALLLGCLEFFVASGILFYLFREEAWVKFLGINHVLNSVIKK